MARLDARAAVYYCNLAEACRAAGELREAVANSKKALELQPGNADAHNHLGLALQGLGKLDEAVAGYREAPAHFFSESSIRRRAYREYQGRTRLGKTEERSVVKRNGGL